MSVHARDVRELRVGPEPGGFYTIRHPSHLRADITPSESFEGVLTQEHEDSNASRVTQAA